MKIVFLNDKKSRPSTLKIAYLGRKDGIARNAISGSHSTAYCVMKRFNLDHFTTAQTRVLFPIGAKITGNYLDGAREKKTSNSL